MYILDTMIDMGLKKGQKWPSIAHKIVAQKVCLCNSLVTDRDTLEDMVQKIIAIPTDQIKKVTPEELAAKYNVPNIRLS